MALLTIVRWYLDLAFTAKIDQTVTVRGRLEPSGSVREVDSPSGGVVGKSLSKMVTSSN